MNENTSNETLHLDQHTQNKKDDTNFDVFSSATSSRIAKRVFAGTSNKTSHKQNKTNGMTCDTPKKIPHEENQQKGETCSSPSPLTHKKKKKKESEQRNKAFEAAAISFERMAQATEAIICEPDQKLKPNAVTNLPNNFVAFGNFIAAELATRERGTDIMCKIMQVLIDENK